MEEFKMGILAIGAHPDDIELGCGGAIARHVQEGYHVIAVVMTAGTAGCHISADRHAESKAALINLGCKQIYHFDYEDTRIGLTIDSMIKSLEEIINEKVPADVRITRVYTMHDSDRHQDHRAVYKASVSACRYIPQILGYETPSTWHAFTPQFFVEISDSLFYKKIEALSYHQSQLHRNYMKTDCLRTVAQFRGIQAGCELSEAFIIHRMVL